MQHSRPPQFPLCLSFKKHRSSIDASRHTIDLILPKPIAAPVWASLPTPPMSGSPPPEPPDEPPQIAGRRRKRSHTPPTTTATTVVPSPATPVEQTAPRLGAQTRTGETIAELPVQPGSYIANYPIPASYTIGSSFTTSATSSLSESTRYLLSPVSPRTTRKPNAHVASACVNCKKKHLRCDNSRPCRRCVQSGKEVGLLQTRLVQSKILTSAGIMSRCRAQEERTTTVEARSSFGEAHLRKCRHPNELSSGRTPQVIDRPRPIIFRTASRTYRPISSIAAPGSNKRPANERNVSTHVCAAIRVFQPSDCDRHFYFTN